MILAKISTKFFSEFYRLYHEIFYLDLRFPTTLIRRFLLVFWRFWKTFSIGYRILPPVAEYCFYYSVVSYNPHIMVFHSIPYLMILATFFYEAVSKLLAKIKIDSSPCRRTFMIIFRPWLHFQADKTLANITHDNIKFRFWSDIIGRFLHITNSCICIRSHCGRPWSILFIFFYLGHQDIFKDYVSIRDHYSVIDRKNTLSTIQRAKQVGARIQFTVKIHSNSSGSTFESEKI